MKYAIIGGTNLESLPIPYKEEVVGTPYGDVVIHRGSLACGQEVIFRFRHGVLFRHDPADINYRANIYAMQMLGVTHIIGLSLRWRMRLRVQGWHRVPDQRLYRHDEEAPALV